MINKKWLLEEYEKATQETDRFLRLLRIAFLLTMVEDKKLLEELAKK